MKKEFAFIDQASFKWSVVGSITLFIFLFLVIFLPFGVNNYDPNHTYTFEWILHIAGFSLVTFIFSMINEFLIKKNVIRKNTFTQIILWYTWSIILYGTCNFHYYNFIGGWHDYSVVSAIQFIFMVGSVLIFPIVGVLFYFNYTTLRQQFDLYLTDSENKIDTSQMLIFKGQGQSDLFSVSVEQFLFAISQDNYVEIYFRDHGKISRHILRLTLKKLEASISEDFIIRCHRSYIANIYQVERIKGKSTEFQLTLKGAEQVIPISKTYADSVLEKLKKYKKA